jgi:hypothetical protein
LKWDSPKEEGSGKGIETKDTYVKDSVHKQMGTSCFSHECTSWAVHDQCVQHKNILKKYIWMSLLVIVSESKYIVTDLLKALSYGTRRSHC